MTMRELSARMMTKQGPVYLVAQELCHRPHGNCSGSCGQRDYPSSMCVTLANLTDGPPSRTSLHCNGLAHLASSSLQPPDLFPTIRRRDSTEKGWGLLLRLCLI